MTQRGPAICLLLLFFIASAKASSAEWFTGHDLGKSCNSLLEDARSADGGVCLAFIQGFIAGAGPGKTSEDSVTGSAEESGSGNETYAERAARTRLGTLRMQQMQSSPLPLYCIDGTTAALDVVRKVTAYLKEHAGGTADLTADDALREALANSFPCQR
jgi:hypothetical protein